MSHIVIISEEPLFCEALAGILARELGCETTSMENTKSLAKLNPSMVDLVISTMNVAPSWEGRVLVIRPGEPRRMSAILGDVTAQLSDKNPAQLQLTDTITLSEKNKKLERLDTGTAIDLTEKELALLLFLKAEGEASREDILKNVWGFAPDVTTHTLETHVYRLRQKWRELAEEDCILATDKGYRWYDHHP